MNSVVIPTFRASKSILDVINRIGPEIGLIVVVDDCCPEFSGRLVQNECKDPRVVVIVHETNQGVGGAFLTGMKAAIERDARIIVKVDSDGQMDPALIPGLILPIEHAQADYVKGNRFFFLSDASSMPAVRLFGNLSLSFMAKISSGYWNIMDPTNGFFAIHADVARLLIPSRIAKRFFFETDLLFHVGMLRAKVTEFPMQAVYGEEVSNLRIARVMPEFMRGHLKNTVRRIAYGYFFRDFSVASIELFFGTILFWFGLIFGIYHWALAYALDEVTPTGTVMIAAVALLIGFQLILAFLSYDIGAVPREALHPLLSRNARTQGPDVGHATANKL